MKTLLALLLAGAAWGATLTVPAQYTYLSDATIACVSDDVIEIAAGTYHDDDGVYLSGKNNITIRGDGLGPVHYYLDTACDESGQTACSFVARATGNSGLLMQNIIFYPVGGYIKLQMLDATLENVDYIYGDADAGTMLMYLLSIEADFTDCDFSTTVGTTIKPIAMDIGTTGHTWDNCTFTNVRLDHGSAAVVSSLFTDCIWLVNDDFTGTTLCDSPTTTWSLTDCALTVAATAGAGNFTLLSRDQNCTTTITGISLSGSYYRLDAASATHNAFLCNTDDFTNPVTITNTTVDSVTTAIKVAGDGTSAATGGVTTLTNITITHCLTYGIYISTNSAIIDGCIVNNHDTYPLDSYHPHNFLLGSDTADNEPEVDQGRWIHVRNCYSYGGQYAYAIKGVDVYLYECYGMGSGNAYQYGVIFKGAIRPYVSSNVIENFGEALWFTDQSTRLPMNGTIKNNQIKNSINGVGFKNSDDDGGTWNIDRNSYSGIDAVTFWNDDVDGTPTLYSFTQWQARGYDGLSQLIPSEAFLDYMGDSTFVVDPAEWGGWSIGKDQQESDVSGGGTLWNGGLN